MTFPIPGSCNKDFQLKMGKNYLLLYIILKFNIKSLIFLIIKLLIINLKKKLSRKKSLLGPKTAQKRYKQLNKSLMGHYPILKIYLIF